MKNPCFAYPGGKAEKRKWILSHVPPGKHYARYIEPFAGRANVFFQAKDQIKANAYWLNDKYAVDFLRAVQQITENEISFFQNLPSQIDATIAKALHDRNDRVGLIAEPLVCFGGGRRESGCSVKTGRWKHTASFVKDLIAARDMLAGVRLTEFDYSDVLSQCMEGDFVYIDPPYCNCDARSYDGDFPVELLARQLESARFDWLLSEYRDQKVVDILGEPLAVRACPLRSDRNFGVGITYRNECLWGNQ